MRQFKMNGYAIVNARRFEEHFSPVEILRDRELAAGFMRHHFQNLSPVHRFHTAVFFGTVFTERKSMIVAENHLSYPALFTGQIHLSLGEKIQVKTELLSSQTHRELAESIWNLVEQTTLKSDDENRDRDILFCLLTAAYSLAKKTLQTCPLTAREAEDAYLRRQDTGACEQDRWLRFEKTGDILLEAREKPYSVLMNQGAARLLAAGEPITHRKLMALPHAQGNNGIPVTLELYSSPQDSDPRRLVFYAGDYRYANFVGDVPVWFHPVQQESEACRMVRSGSSLTCVDKRRDKLILKEQNVSLDIIGFAVEEHAGGYLLLTELGLDDFGYTRRLSRRIWKKDIVQVAFRGTECLLLDRFGTVYSGLQAVQTGVTALDEDQR